MKVRKTISGIKILSLFPTMIVLLIFNCIACNGDRPAGKTGKLRAIVTDSSKLNSEQDDYKLVNAILVSPKNPVPGEPFRILATGGEMIRKAHIIINGTSGNLNSLTSKISEGLSFWRIDNFSGSSAGKYKAELIADNKIICELEFEISSAKPVAQSGVVWKTIHGWDSSAEAIYSAWINSLFYGCNEQASWSSLNEVTQNQNQNFLYNYLSLGEDDPAGKNPVIMKPDCADNPFYLRAYFAWKLGLPFGYHLCDRGYLNHNPGTGQWITNESSSSKTNTTLAFNAFLRRVADGVHSGTGRTALDNENSDYYPVSLEQRAIRPGTVYADPYGHTLILVTQETQTKDTPGLLLSVDAQPDGTVGIKRFWKGNFLFNTTGVVGEPGFKAFRPIAFNNGTPRLLKNKELTETAGFVPFSLQQRKMETSVFYHTMERIINPKPLDPETALSGLIQALHEQLLVRVTSVANGEAYYKLHPGTIIPMPSGAAGIFLAGGQWENFSTPNRDLRLLIAMDAVLEFPDIVANSPEDFKISGRLTTEQMKNKLLSILKNKVSELSISYTRTDGSVLKLTVGEILKRKDAFEMAYNPNDGIEIRWGAPVNSNEMATCRRHAPLKQQETMRSVRTWFNKRLHPPT